MTMILDNDPMTMISWQWSVLATVDALRLALAKFFNSWRSYDLFFYTCVWTNRGQLLHSWVLIHPPREKMISRVESSSFSSLETIFPLYSMEKKAQIKKIIEVHATLISYQAKKAKKMRCN